LKAVKHHCTAAKVLPKLPKTQNDIALEGAWTETTAGESFLLNDDTNELSQRILIFATDSNLRMLCDSNTVFGDGTFYSCPGLFYQLYTLHGYVEDTSYPLVFALLPNKTKQAYTRLFTMLKGALLQNNLFLTPQLVLMDFETAARNALKAVFSTTDIKSILLFTLHSVYGVKHKRVVWLDNIDRMTT
jgi:hypothetical protein